MDPALYLGQEIGRAHVNMESVIAIFFDIEGLLTEVFHVLRCLIGIEWRADRIALKSIYTG